MNKSTHESVAEALLLVLEANRSEPSISNLIDDLSLFVSAPSKLPSNTKRSLDCLIESAKPSSKGYYMPLFNNEVERKAYY